MSVTILKVVIALALFFAADGFFVYEYCKLDPYPPNFGGLNHAPSPK